MSDAPKQTIRIPKKGVTANSRRIAAAVDDQAWQEFRVSLKGKDTKVKLQMLEKYRRDHSPLSEDDKIRLHNYITALSRGGQLGSGMSLDLAIKKGGIDKLPIRKAR